MTPIVHITPVEDLIEHEESEGCVCGPEMEPVPCDDGSMGWIINHHSLDGREEQES